MTTTSNAGADASRGHTPGPWAVVEHEVWDTRHDGEPGIPLFRRVTDYRRWGRDFKTGEQEANARLIAAAPELLEALSKAVKWLAICDDPRCMKDLHAAEAAIAKARTPAGETK